MSEKRIFAKSFEEMISILGTTDIIFEKSQEAIGKVADILNIQRVESGAEIPANKFTPQGATINHLFYDRNIEEKDVTKEKMQEVLQQPFTYGSEVKFEYVTGENGIISAKAFSCPDIIWNQEDKDQVCSLLKVLLSYAAKTRLVYQMKKNGFLDIMTGMANADGFVAKGNQYGKQGILKNYAAFYWNVKNLKAYNQQYGARVGDKVLREIAAKVQNSMEADEIPGRLGGDNFVALVRRENVLRLVNLLETMTVQVEGMDGQNIELEIRSTCGVYPIENTVQNMSVVMQKVSSAYRTAKDILHKNTVIYSMDIEKKIMEGKKIQLQFNDALKNQDFLVYYQPKVDLQTMTMNGAEALVRWSRDNRIASPGEFISVLEKDESICKLDFYVLNQVCKDLRKWIDAGINPVRVSVNFSRRHLANRYLVYEILEVLNRYRIPRRYIEIEITETTTLEEKTQLEAIFRKLHEEGIFVSIDDFGSGYSSLNMLRGLEVDMLKIDRSFIVDATNNTRDLVVLTNIIRLADELGISVITEGVETEEQLELLKKLKCNLVQGFYFDHPLPVEQFEMKVKTKSYA